MCYCPTPTLYLNLALTGDCAFQLSPKKPHSVWFISVLKSGDMGQCPEKSPSPCNTCVIPVSLYKSMSWFVTKTRTHTHTHTHPFYIVTPYTRWYNFRWRPPSIPSRTGLPLLISNASSSAGVKLAGGGPPPVPATPVFFLAAAIKKNLMRLNSCNFKLAMITYLHTIRFTYHSEQYFYILFSPAARFFFLHLSCCCVNVIAITVIHTQTLQCIVTHI